MMLHDAEAQIAAGLSHTYGFSWVQQPSIAPNDELPTWWYLLG